MSRSGEDGNDNARGIYTIVPHDLERVGEDEKQLAKHEREEEQQQQ